MYYDERYIKDILRSINQMERLIDECRPFHERLHNLVKPLQRELTEIEFYKKNLIEPVSREWLTEVERTRQFMASDETLAVMLKKHEESYACYADLANELGMQSKLRDYDLHNAAMAWELGMTNASMWIKELDFMAKNRDTALRLLEPGRVYNDFVNSTFDMLNSATTIESQKALRASLYITETQYIDINSILSDIISVPSDNLPPSTIRTLRTPYVQRSEILTMPTIEAEYDEEQITKVSPAAATSAKATIILETVVQCNQISNLSGESIFKPTTRMLESFTDLPWLVADDRRSIGDVIDGLYFILYEGAGKDKLRFLKDQGGPLISGECEFIWNLKTLRNKWLRHDPEHGSHSDIKATQSQLSAALQWFGFDTIPTQPQQFRSLQISVLERCVTFLKTLLQKLS